MIFDSFVLFREKRTGTGKNRSPKDPSGKTPDVFFNLITPRYNTFSCSESCGAAPKVQLSEQPPIMTVAVRMSYRSANSAVVSYALRALRAMPMPSSETRQTIMTMTAVSPVMTVEPPGSVVPGLEGAEGSL